MRLIVTTAALLLVPAVAAAESERCWNKEDAACEQTRDGEYPMDLQVLEHVLKKVKAAKDDEARQEAAAKALDKRYLTVMQLGRVLALFSDEVVMVDVVKDVAKRVVDTKSYEAIKTSFKNTTRADEAAKAIKSSSTAGNEIDRKLNSAKKQFGVKF